MKKGCSFFITGITIFFISCAPSSRGLFTQKTPHELYEKRLTDAGLHTTALGTSWINAAKSALQQPATIQLPYKETGYFAAERPLAFAYAFKAQRGEQIAFSVQQDTLPLMIFTDLWRKQEDGKTEFIKAADSVNQPTNWEVNKDGLYILRVQSELLKSGTYTVTITTGPSLAFPVQAGEKATVGSFWGANRDGGVRKHEGIDIFGKRGAPLVAAADGTISAVREGGIGGKVVFLRPAGKDYTLYYAHLDSQTVQAGQPVKTGDVVGLMGNTGNAKTTTPHLHFGIYAIGGAIDPLPFVKTVTIQPANITIPLDALGKFVRSTKTIKTIKANTPMRVIGATSSSYKVELPEGQIALVPGNDVTKAIQPVAKHSLTATQLLLDVPGKPASAKKAIQPGTVLNVYGAYGNFLFVEHEGLNGWVNK